jgi:hypothetical protein
MSVPAATGTTEEPQPPSCCTRPSWKLVNKQHRAPSKCQLAVFVSYARQCRFGGGGTPHGIVCRWSARGIWGLMRLGGRGCWLADEVADGGGEFAGVGEWGEVTQLG